jgi:glycosyltransferase involved in cell wall biosynthesis
MADRPIVLWLHTQPEHYFNCMIDDLNKAGGATGGATFVAGFMHKGAGTYKDTPLPAGKSILLTPVAGKSEATAFGKFHVDWRKELLPVGYDMVIVSGYATRTPREVIKDAHARKLPVAMWSDSNLRSQRGRDLKARVRRRVKKAGLKSIIAATDYLLTANSLGVAYWRYYGAPRSKIVLCPCYSDYSRIDAARALTREEALAKFNRLPSDRILMTAARLVPAKGLDLMIDAFKKSGVAERGFHWIIAGMGPLEAELKARAGELLGKAIHFAGFQQPKDVYALMAHADLFVLPSRYEPHGIVIPESLASGTPVLASDVCGAAADLVFPGVSGELFRSDDAGDLQKKLTGLLGDAEKLAAMRATSRRTFEEWLDETSPIKVVTELVQKVLGRK